MQGIKILDISLTGLKKALKPYGKRFGERGLKTPVGGRILIPTFFHYLSIAFYQCTSDFFFLHT